MGTKLDETDDFLDLYIHHAGRSMVPQQFHYWCALTLLGAAVADRVYYRKFADKKLAPNLYTFLIGPSGSGKGEAIDTATKFVRGLEARIPFARGKLTAAAMTDLLSGKKKTDDKVAEPERAHLFLVTPELTRSVGVGPFARDFLTFMTELYTGSPDPIRDHTRTHGVAVIKTPPVVNWLAGTTERWMVESVTPSDVESGFMARVALVEGDYKYDPELVDPLYPADREAIAAHLAARVRALTHLNGEFVLTDAAAAVRREWFRVRHPRSDRRLMPWFQREDDLALKLGMLFALSGGGWDRKIHRTQIARGQRLAEQLTEAARKTVSYAQSAGDDPGTSVVKRLLADRKLISRPELVKLVMGRGKIDSIHRLNEILALLESGGFVTTVKASTGANYYAIRRDAPLRLKPGRPAKRREAEP